MTDLVTTRLAVLGAGPGGYAAAFYAADLGMDVTLIDKEANPGGICLFRGCIPSKALLHVAKVISEAKHAANVGVTFAEPAIDLDRVRAWKNEVIGKLTGGLGQLSRQRKIQYLQGTASFEDSNTINVTMADGARKTVRFQHAILATGSRPTQIPGLPYDSPHLLDSTGALDLPSLPKKMLVIGGGYIGLELGTVYAALGSRVTVVEMTDGLLPGADRDLVTFVARRVESTYEKVLLKTKVVSVAPEGDGLRVQWEAPDGAGSDLFEKVLVSVGRRPNTENLGLEKTRIQVEKGFVKVDAARRTAEPSIFAIGDVAGNPMLAHKASHEGRVAVEAIAGKRVAFEPRAIPAVVFTDPELAWCGLSENDAVAANKPVKIARFPWAASGRALTMDRSDGMTKLVIDPDDERVLGMGIVGPGAGELISEGVLAVEMGAVAADIKLSIHPHPTLSETVMEAAESFFGHSTHVYKPRR